MSYITQQDIVDRLGEELLLQLTDDDGAGTLTDPKIIRQIDLAIGYAVGTIDSYARTRYTIPVPTTQQITSACLDLAIFKLFERRATVVDEGVFKVHQLAHDRAIKWLQDLSTGKAALDVPSAQETAEHPATPDRVLRGSSLNPGVFSDEKLSGY